MRKIIAFVLVITAVIVLFTACSDDKPDDGTTLDPLYTAYIPSSSTTGQSVQNPAASTAANAATGATYILTTNQSKTAPWYSTTRFVPSAVTTGSGVTTNNYNNITYTTNPAMLSPSVTANVSNAPSTTWKPLTTTTRPNTTRVTAPTTTKPTTTKPQPVGVDVEINDIFISPEGKLCVAIDPAGWGTKIKSASKRVPICIDNIEADSPALLQISSSTNGDGYQYMYIDLTDFEVLDYGGTVSFIVPEGFLSNSSGTKYNNEFEVTY